MLVVDPYVLDKHFNRFRRGKRTLSAVCEHYRVTLDEAHAANADALAAARVAFRLGASVAELRDIDLDVLHREQVSWAAERAASLEDHLRAQGRNQRVERVWPVIPDGLARAA
ncbi:MAG: hypothetical protein ACLP1Q_15480 [Solirubrobacteraceae bacterium]